MRLLCLTLAAMLLLAPLPCHSQSAPPSNRQRITTGVTAMQEWYVQQTGLYATTGWWNSANAVTALVDASRVTGQKANSAVLANTFEQAQKTVPKEQQTGKLQKMTGFPGFLNRYYDDEGWWALAWIDAYDLTGEPRYLAMGQSIFKDMSGGWDQTCGGGIWWSKDRNYKNAIANELFFSVAAHLATRAGSTEAAKEYLDWARRDWEWFQRSGMINGDHLVNDGLTIDKTEGSCRNNGRTTWTYNQGVVLGALTEWSKTSHDPNALMEARMIADASLIHLTDGNGILHDSCEPDHCGEDAPQFKGIFARNLSALNTLVHEPRYAAFFRANAESIWNDSRTPAITFGLVWSGPPGVPDASTQSSALDVFNAAAAIGR